MLRLLKALPRPPGRLDVREPRRPPPEDEDDC
jgi:hypothetical protein